jgi:hypothetical protein
VNTEKRIQALIAKQAVVENARAKREADDAKRENDIEASPCVVTNPSPPSGWVEDFHLQVTEHVQHTTKPLAR